MTSEQRKVLDPNRSDANRSGAERLRDARVRVQNEKQVCALAEVMVDAIRESGEVYKYPRLVAAFRLAGLLPEETGEALEPELESEAG